MTILLSDPRVAGVPVLDCGEPLVALDASFGPARAVVRAGLADRLALAQDLLPRGLRLRVVEGHRSVDRPARDHRPLLRGGLRRCGRASRRTSCTTWSRGSSPRSRSPRTWPARPST